MALFLPARNSVESAPGADKACRFANPSPEQDQDRVAGRKVRGRNKPVRRYSGIGRELALTAFESGARRS
jgi:hypothetical protein